MISTAQKNNNKRVFVATNGGRRGYEQGEVWTMNDTPPEMQKRYHDMLMRRSGEERLKMGCSMYDAAKSIVKSSVLNEQPGLNAGELKEKIFLRFYGLDFPESQKQKIMAGLRE